MPLPSSSVRMVIGAFEADVVPRALEGGLTSDQLLDRYPEAVREPDEALDLAMALETDALDLYLRMADAFDDEHVRAIFFDLAKEERAHLKKIGTLRGSYEATHRNS